uniref:Uncharacterized protein n=1 Tax=Enterobacter cloacae TaxID=550 RepID=A0A2L1KQA2_ENTCL|nr:hypothetical protein [Enterobacter cloacae]
MNNCHNIDDWLSFSEEPSARQSFSRFETIKPENISRRNIAVKNI